MSEEVINMGFTKLWTAIRQMATSAIQEILSLYEYRK